MVWGSSGLGLAVEINQEQRHASRGTDILTEGLLGVPFQIIKYGDRSLQSTGVSLSRALSQPHNFKVMVRTATSFSVPAQSQGIPVGTFMGAPARLLCLSGAGPCGIATMPATKIFLDFRPHSVGFN